MKTILSCSWKFIWKCDLYCFSYARKKCWSTNNEWYEYGFISLLVFDHTKNWYKIKGAYLSICCCAVERANQDRFSNKKKNKKWICSRNGNDDSQAEKSDSNEVFYATYLFSSCLCCHLFLPFNVISSLLFLSFCHVLSLSCLFM